MEPIELLMTYKHAEITRRPNKMLIPVSQIPMTKEGADLFNQIYFFVKDDPNMHLIEWSPKGGISKRNLRLPAYGIKYGKTWVDLTILRLEGMWRFQFRSNVLLEHREISGRQAFVKFLYLLKKHGINLADYKVPYGRKVKTEIEKPYIKLKRQSSADRTYIGANHIDFHSSYAAGLANTHSEFREVLEEIYKERKTKPINKAILNYSIGYMQSLGGCQARYAELSRDAIADNNRRIEALTKALEDSGHVILMYNTDGIWYTGGVYHGEGEGDGLGEWSNDYINCQFRAKSAGVYEFLELDTGKYKAVVRGRTKLDEVKPRDQWEWGDIYNAAAAPIMYEFSTETGAKRIERGPKYGL